MVVYCTESDIDSILSTDGVDARIDDLGDGSTNSTNIAAAIEQASEKVNFYLSRRYVTAYLTQSAWVKWATATIAAWIIARRRGNPVMGSLEEDYTKYVEQLEQINRGEYDVPNVAPRFDVTPAVSNYTVDGRFDRTKIRKIQPTSTGGPQQPGRKEFQSVDYLPGY